MSESSVDSLADTAAGLLFGFWADFGMIFSFFVDETGLLTFLVGVYDVAGLLIGFDSILADNNSAFLLLIPCVLLVVLRISSS